MSIASDVQKLEPGALVELFEFDGTSIGAGVLRFHKDTTVGKIIFQGVEYSPWPIEAEGFALDTDRPPTPTLRVANLDGSISLLCAHFEDLVGARIVRRRTLAKYLDEENFPDGNPTADPDAEFPLSVWFIERKVSETNEMVEFELSSALDFNGVKLPRRQIIAGLCSWRYRGADCGYTGGPVATIDDEPTSNPNEDRCSHRMSGCRLRFPNPDDELPFGGFPAADLARM